MNTKNKDKVTAYKRSPFKRIWRFITRFILTFFIVSISWVVLARFIPVFVTPLMLIRSVESVVDGKMPSNHKKWVSIDHISPNMAQAVVASEDNMFLHHHGFSFEAISKAYKHNQNGRKIRGGSTISQQTAKNVFLWPQRSYFRKGLEAYFTVLIELIWSKERIMEVYLNVIEMGDGIYGIEAASQDYFGHSAEELTKSQAAYIAVCLPNPRKYSPVNPSPYIRWRKSTIVSLMGKLPQIDFQNQHPIIKSKKKHKHKHK